MYNRTLILILLLLATHVCVAQDRGEVKLPRTFLKISPQVISNTLAAGVERMNKSFTKSLQANIGYRYGARDFKNSYGAHLELAFKNYIEPFGTGGASQVGMYYSLFLQGSAFSAIWSSFGEDGKIFYDETRGIVVDHLKVDILAIAPGFTFGLHEVYRNRICIDIYGGVGFRFVDITSPGDFQRSYPPASHADPAHDGVTLRAGVSFGLGL